MRLSIPLTCTILLVTVLASGLVRPQIAEARKTHNVVVKNVTDKSIRVKIVGFDNDAVCDVDLRPGASSGVQNLIAGRRVLCIWDKNIKVLKRLQVLDVNRAGMLEITTIDPTAANLFVILDDE